MPKGDVRKTYLKMAGQFADLSYAKRKQVGALLVSADNKRILSYGYNGMPPGMPNCCELDDGTTNPLVLHAELACIGKCAKEGQAVQDSILYLTLSPCIQCSKLIFQTGPIVTGKQFGIPGGIPI